MKKEEKSVQNNEKVLPNIVSRDQWLIERKKLLKKEKEFTRQRDKLNADRRRLPMVAIKKEYTFESAEGKVSLLDLFEGRSQLIVYHFMFEPHWHEGCPSCSFVADNIGHLSHLHARDTTLVMVSRAPLEKIEKYKARMGWTLPWYSSFGSEFNYDFNVTIDEAIAPVEYNYKDKASLEKLDPNWIGWKGEQPGTSVFLNNDNNIYHTYSSYARGGEPLMGTYTYLDITPLGRQEEWEEPPGRSDSKAMEWLRRHDQYD